MIINMRRNVFIDYTNLSITIIVLTFFLLELFVDLEKLLKDSSEKFILQPLAFSWHRILFFFN